MTCASRVHLRLAAAAAVLALAVAVSGCETDRQSGAVAGAPPRSAAPVGPIPGPGRAEPAANPYGGDAVAMAEGRRLFVRFNCAGCHGGHGGGGMGPSLRDPAWIYGSSPAAIHDSIAEGRAHGMPSWRQLPDDYVWKLTAYIESLGTSAEPEAPR